jgi:hypothetical protein
MKNITELSRIDFNISSGSLGEVVRAYSEEAEALARLWCFELEVAAADSQSAMSSLKGHPLLFGLDCWAKARRVAYRLRRAREMAHGIGVEARKFQSDYRKHFNP